MENEMKQINGVRKNYLDNIRWITVVLVMVYHVIYLFIWFLKNCMSWKMSWMQTVLFAYPNRKLLI